MNEEKYFIAFENYSTSKSYSSIYLLVDKSRDTVEDVRIESDQKSLQRVKPRDIFALFRWAGCPQSRSRSARRSSGRSGSGEHYSTQFLHRCAQQIGSFLRALDPRELPPALRAGAGLHGAGTAQMINASQHQPNDLLVSLGDAEYSERGDNTIKLDHSSLFVFMFLQGCDEGIVFGD